MDMGDILADLPGWNGDGSLTPSSIASGILYCLVLTQFWDGSGAWGKSHGSDSVACTYLSVEGMEVRHWRLDPFSGGDDTGSK